MADEAVVGASASAAQGAAALSWAGPWGIAIGAVVGGAIGLFSGEKKKKARKYMRKAQEQRRRQQQMKLAVQRRDLIRQQRMLRAQAVAAGSSEQGVTSSAVLGAIGSVDAQGKSAMSYFDAQIDLDMAYQMYSKKAGKAAGDAAELDTLLAAGGSLVTAAGDIYGLTRRPATSTTTGVYASFNNSAAQTNMANNPAFTSFGSSLDLP